MLEMSIILNDKVAFDSNELLDYINSFKDTVVSKEYAESKLRYFVEHDNKVKAIGSMLTGVAITSFNYSTCYAYDINSVPNKVTHAFDPLLEIAIALGQPMASLMLVVGFIMIITGKKAKGFEIIKWVIIGFVGLQFAPYIMGLLVEIGKSLRGSLY